MEVRSDMITKAAHFLHGRLLWLLIGSYAVAAVCPGPGLWVKSLSVGRIVLAGEPLKLSAPMLMLAALLFNAGLCVSLSRLRGLARRPAALPAGLLANTMIPMAYIIGVDLMMRTWHNPDEVQTILAGLALVAAMPIAGSSTAWSQNAEGDLALSLGLVLGSTLLSPLLTPLALHGVGFLAKGGYARDLHALASGGVHTFLVVGVILPSVLGIASRVALGGERVDRARSGLKVVNCLVLLFLNYANASVSLPSAIARPDPDFLGATLGLVLGLCTLTFCSGWVIARLLREPPDRTASLTFGLGMSNNGTALVLASVALADHPRVMLPIILYNLVQHLVAGAADRFLRKRLRSDRESAVQASPRPVLGGM